MDLNRSHVLFDPPKEMSREIPGNLEPNVMEAIRAGARGTVHDVHERLAAADREPA